MVGEFVSLMMLLLLLLRMMDLHSLRAGEWFFANDWIGLISAWDDYRGVEMR
jgi:hypothetical protein